MKKKIITKRSPAKVKKSKTDLITTSVAFKPDNITQLKAHPLHTKRDLSVSWIINKLVEKLLAGEVSVE